MNSRKVSSPDSSRDRCFNDRTGDAIAGFQRPLHVSSLFRDVITTSLYPGTLPRGYKRKFYEALTFRVARRVIDPLCGFAIIAWLGPENIGHKCLRVAIIEREPT